MLRRDLLKLSALSLAGLGVRELCGAPTTPTLPSGTDEPVGPALEPRARPSAMEVTWAAGTGLIWMKGETLFYDNPRNRFMRFRRKFDAPANVVRAELRLWADTHYIAWLNGEEIARGPGRSDWKWALFDTHDVTARLRPGGNTLAVLALFQGFGTGGRQSLMQALLAHLAIETADGKKLHVVSDTAWKTSPAPEFLRPTPRLHATLGCMEVQDLRLAEDGWQQPAFDDRAWTPSDYVKPSLGMGPWYYFAPEPLPARTLDEVAFPVAARGDEVALALPPVDALGAVRPSLALGRQVTLPARLSGREAGTVQVISLDLGRDECGYFEADVTGPAGATIDLLCGEMLVDGRVPKPGTARVHTTRFILRGGRQTLRVAFNWLALRHAQLWVWTPGEFTLHRATLRRLTLPLGEGGHFACDDDFLNRLDTICAHTLRLCAQDGIVDSSSREQQQWIGDGRFTAMTLHHRFAAGAIHRRLIEQVGQGIDWMGSLVPRFPTGNLNVSPIPLYSLHWVLAFRDYAWFTGDTALAREWWPMVLHALRWFTAFEREDGLVANVPHWMYIDLGEGPRPGRVPSTGAVNATLNFHYLAAARVAAEFAAEFGDPVNARHFRAKARRLEAANRRAFWDEATGAYRDSLDARGGFGTLSEGTNAFALIHLEAPGSARAARILETIFATPAADPIKASPFTMNAVLDALGRHGRGELAIPRLKQRYAPQLETGSTWEHWRSHHVTEEGVPEGHSLSHAWGAGPLAFFVNTIAGIRPASPGWATVRIAPQPAGLARAEASVVTARGRIAVRWERAGGRFTLHATLPADVTGECVLPDGTTAALRAGGNAVAGADPVA